MKAIRMGKVVLIGAVGLLMAATPAGQENPGRGGRPAGGPGRQGAEPGQEQQDSQRDVAKVRVIALQHASAHEIGGIVGNVVVGARVIADERTNSIIVAGSDETVARVEDLAAKLDVPRPDPLTELQTRYYELKYPIRDNAMAMIQRLAAASRVAADGRLLAAQGPEGDLTTIAQLVEKLNASYSAPATADGTPPRAITANFFFIETRMDGGDAQNAVSLPGALQPVAATLEQNGFHNASLLAPLMVNLVESPGGNEFHLEGSAGAEGAIDVDLSGTVRSAPGSQRVDLSVRAQLMERAEVQTGRSIQGQAATATINRKIFTIETRLEVKLGDYVILAATPSSAGDGRAIALAVRATAGE